MTKVSNSQKNNPNDSNTSTDAEVSRGAVVQDKKEAKAPKEKKPPKPNVRATEDEIRAAIAGELKPRTTLGTSDQKSLGQRAASGKPVGSPLGLTTGLPPTLCYCYVFQTNEKASAKPNTSGKLGDGKMTDEQLSKFLKSEFPGRETDGFNKIGAVRLAYNGGRYTRAEPPTTKSMRYNDKGEIMERAPRAKKSDGQSADSESGQGKKGKKGEAPVAATA